MQKQPTLLEEYISDWRKYPTRTGIASLILFVICLLPFFRPPPPDSAEQDAILAKDKAKLAKDLGYEPNAQAEALMFQAEAAKNAAAEAAKNAASSRSD